MTTRIVHATLVAKNHEFGGYTIYVFELLDKYEGLDKYVLCVRMPNWNHENIDIGETGYLEFVEITAGQDTYFDGRNTVPYKYSTWQFIKFVRQKDNNISKELFID